MLKVGFAEVDMTPAPGLLMAGMPQPPRAEGVQWPLYGRIAVFDDGERSVAIVCVDLLLLLSSTVAELRDAITAGTDVAPTDVLINCNHTHRAPYTASLMDEPPDFDYLDLVQERLTGCMRAALEVRQPAGLRVGKIDAPGWTFNRRPVYRTERGEQVGTQGPFDVEHFVRMEGPEDHQLQVLLVEDLEGRTLGGLVCFACHTTLMGAEPVHSADFAGPLTEALAERHGGIWGFVQGCSGNLWAINMAQERPFAEPAVPRTRRMGLGLADKAGEALQSARPVSAPRIHAAREVLRCPQRRPTREQVELARWYLEDAPAEIDEDEWTQRHYVRDYTFYANSSVIQEWFMRETIGMWEWQRRDGAREPAENLEVQAITIGDVAFVGFPGEIFVEFGLAVKDRSPFPDTFAAGLTNGWHGYVPTQEAFEHGGYEPRLGYQSRLVPETGERLCAAAIRLLDQLVAS